MVGVAPVSEPDCVASDEAVPSVLVCVPLLRERVAVKERESSSVTVLLTSRVAVGSVKVWDSEDMDFPQLTLTWADIDPVNDCVGSCVTDLGEGERLGDSVTLCWFVIVSDFV